MYQYEEIRMIHLEITNKCNAACPQCPRNDQGGRTIPSLNLSELTLEDIQKILPAEFVSQLQMIRLCGNFGDPSNARDILKVLYYFREINKEVYINVYTNGGARQPGWWAELGNLITQECGYVRFGIDGLEDTNHLYRRNVRWVSVVENVKAFIGAGGNAEWEFLVFKHNEHQVEAAKTLASQMGFSQFFAKSTGRFMDYASLMPLVKTPVKNKTGRIEYYLMRPTSPKWRNDTLERLTDAESRKNGFCRDFLKRVAGIVCNKNNISRYLDETIITCKVVPEKAIYISANGHVFPCCWLAFHVHGQLSESIEFNRQLERIGGIESLDGRHRPLRDIINDIFFQSYIPESWCKNSISAGRLKTCALMCGTEFNYLKIEHQKKNLLNPDATQL